MSLRGGDRRLSVVAALAAASVLCAFTVELRIRHTGNSSYRFLDWNLLLAWLPLLFAAAASACARARATGPAIAFGVLWLLFFPNAPYMLTDFIHLRESSRAPLWYDALMLSSFAWTALTLGFVSLYLMHMIWQRAVGSAAAWAGVVAALGLASLGVYIGRFVGFNSWDALLRPGQVAHVIRTELENPLLHPRIVGSLAVLTGFLTVAYTVLYSVSRLQLETDQGGA